MRSAIVESVAVVVLAEPVLPQAASRDLTPEDYRQMNDDFASWSHDGWRYQRIQSRAEQLYPARRDNPLRDLNITDDEVREVVAIAQQYLPRSMVNISPVVTNCPCEEGPVCTAQVYVLASANGKTRGLQLSRMNRTWQLGIVQQWWLRYGSIEPPREGSSFREYYLAAKARHELLDQFPTCAGHDVPVMNDQIPAAKK